jgi:hypothetical protein
MKAGVSIQADDEWQNKMPVFQKVALGLMGLHFFLNSDIKSKSVEKDTHWKHRPTPDQ